MSSQTPPVSAAERYADRKKNGKKKAAIIGVAAAVVLAAGGVAAGIALNSKNNSASSTVNNSELNIGLLLEPTNLNIRETSGVALDQVLLDNVYEGLITVKSGSITEFEPLLAESMPLISADGKEYTFKLREGVKFHSGAELDTTDVVDSLNASLAAGLQDGNTATVTAGSDNEVKITLSAPSQMLLWQLAGRSGIIFDSAATNDLASSADGTGPYKLERWKQGDSIALGSNPDYWGADPSFNTVNFKFIPDGRAAVNALKSGDLDVHTALLPTLRQEFSGNSDFTLERAASTDVFTLAFNNAKAPFDDIEVRQALSAAIDTEAVIASQAGDGKSLGSPITELEPGYIDLTAQHSYDPEKAKQVLADKGLTGTEMVITAPNFYDQAPLDIVASQLREAGINAKINRVEFSTWLEQVYTNHDFDLSYVNHTEARDFANYANPEYYFGYNSSAVQDLYAAALTANDAAQSDQLLREASMIVADNAPAKWLYNYTPTVVLSNQVQNFPLANTNARINLAGVTKSE